MINQEETYIKHRRKYKIVMEQLLKEHVEISKDYVCSCCGMIAINENCCDGCDKGVCYKCDTDIEDEKYKNYYSGDYGFILCPSCHSDFRIEWKRKGII